MSRYLLLWPAVQYTGRSAKPVLRWFAFKNKFRNKVLLGIELNFRLKQKRERICIYYKLFKNGRVLMWLWLLLACCYAKWYSKIMIYFSPRTSLFMEFLLFDLLLVPVWNIYCLWANGNQRRRTDCSIIFIPMKKGEISTKNTHII